VTASAAIYLGGGAEDYFAGCFCGILSFTTNGGYFNDSTGVYRMTDLMEFETLPAALKLVATNIAEVDLARGRDALSRKFEVADFFLADVIGSSRDPYATVNKASRDSWSTRELAIIKFQSGVNKGGIEIYFRDPGSSSLIKIAPGDLCGAVYFEEITRGGVVRAAAGESIEKYRGWDALTKADSVRRWSAAEKLRRPAADEGKCQAWLFAGMLASPYQKLKAKREWRIEATRLFGVNVRAFNRAWASAIEASGSTWDQSGAPHKSSQ
jgi:hypothetical protein